MAKRKTPDPKWRGTAAARPPATNLQIETDLLKRVVAEAERGTGVAPLSHRQALEWALRSWLAKGA